MSQQDPSPVPSGYGKLQGGSLSGAIAIVVIFLLDTYVFKPPLPDYVVGAITLIIANIGVLFTPQHFSVSNLIPKGSSVTKALPFLVAILAATALSACATAQKTANPSLGNQFATVLSRIMNTSASDLTTAQNVANAATPPDRDGANCAAAVLVVQGQVGKVMQAQGSGTQGAFTTAEMLSLFQPGSAQFNQAYNTVASGCIAKANDVMGAANVLLAGGIAGVLAATNTVIPLGAALP